MVFDRTIRRRVLVVVVGARDPSPASADQHYQRLHGQSGPQRVRDLMGEEAEDFATGSKSSMCGGPSRTAA